MFSITNGDYSLYMFLWIIFGIVLNHSQICRNKLHDSYLNKWNKIVKINSNDQPWVTDKFRDLIHLRQYHLNAGNTLLYDMYLNKTNRLRKALKRNFFQSKMAEVQNGKQWWKTINDITGRKQKIDGLQTMCNTLCDSDDQKLAQLIDNAFQRVTQDMTPISHHDNFCIGQDWEVPETDLFHKYEIFTL